MGIKIKKNILLFVFLFSFVLVTAITKAPLPPGHIKTLCDEENASWICDDTAINDINCCKCSDEDKKFYYNLGCVKPEDTPENKCKNSNGEWKIDNSISPVRYYCECPKDYILKDNECITQKISFFSKIINFLKRLLGFK